MLETGKFAFDTVNSASVQILEKIEAWGYLSYRVFNPATGTVYKVTADQLKEDGGTNTYDENYLQYVTLLSKTKKDLLPSTSSADINTVPPELFTSFNLIFYNSVEDAVFKALGVE